jgi:O-antigen ligase
MTRATMLPARPARPPRSRRGPVLAVCLVPATFVAGNLRSGLPLAPVYVAVLAAVGLVGLHRLRRPDRTAGVTGAAGLPVLVAAALLVASAVLATVTAIDPAAALRLDVGYALGLALAVAVPVACPGPGAVRLLAGVTCAAGAVACATGLATGTHASSQFGGALIEGRAQGVFGQPNDLGAFAAAVLLLALGLTLGGGLSRTGRVAAGAAAAVAAGALALSLSRGSWIGGAVGLVVLLVLVGPAARRRAARTAAVLALMAGAVVLAAPGTPVVSVLLSRAGTLVNGTRNPYDDRPAIWRAAVRLWSDHLLLGVGPGGYPLLVGRDDPLRVATPLHAHDVVLTVGAEQGLLGLAALAAVVAAGVRTVARARTCRRPDEGVLVGAAAALAALLGQGLVDFPLRNPVLQILVWLLVGLLVAAAGPVRVVRSSPWPARSSPASG